MLQMLPFGNRRNFDGRDEGRVAFQIGVTFWQDANGGELVIPKVVGDKAEPPAENDDIGGGKDERYFLRRIILVVFGVRVGIKREFDQLAGVEGAAMLFVEVELDAGGIGVGRQVAAIFRKHGHNVWWLMVRCRCHANGAAAARLV
jgi:hypothetical protein